MNERIKELCSQAISDVDGIQNPDTQHMYIPDCFRDRFAELIVRECIQAVDNVGGYNEEFHMNAIKEHFGVEE
jgi:hypothetical protein